MILRERQKELVSKSVKALQQKKNTLSVAPTGAGKTVCMAAVASELRKKLDKPILVLQHRDELVTQNAATFKRYIGKGFHPRVINADSKTFDRSAEGAHFAMVQTLSRQATMDRMPPMGAILIDEAHHAVADTYMRLIYKAREDNPDMMLYGTTATPNRGDSKGLIGVFDNCADQISIGELINDGHLVRPRCFVVDVGTQDDLRKVKRKAADFDMNEVEKIMNKRAINDEVVKHWKEKAGDRQTIVFCSKRDHAADVTQAFCDAGIKAAMVDGTMSLTDRRAVLRDYDENKYQVLVNVAVLTEGFDHQPTSCVVLLRPSSWKSTMMQMVGRGLRKVDPEKYPGVIKDDCIVLDFGTSMLIHQNLFDDTDLKGAGTKECSECGAEVPTQVNECPICGFEFPRTVPGNDEDTDDTGDAPRAGPDGMAGLVLTEIDILDSSPFKYESLAGGLVQVCTGFTAWASVVTYKGRHYAVGGRQDEDTGRRETHLLSNSSEYILALQTADDWMREYGDATAAKKSKRWLTQAPTSKQADFMGRLGINLTAGEQMSLTKYRAACMIEWGLNSKKIKAHVTRAAA